MKETMIDIEKFTQMPIVHMIKHATFFKGFSVYIHLNDKFIKLNLASDPFVETLQNILQKGATHIYIETDDLAKILSNFQSRMINHDDPNFSETASQELKISENETVILLAQNFIKNLGLNSEVLKQIQQSNKNILSLINKSTHLKTLMEQFRKNCSEDFYKISLTNYICSLILNQFPWKTPQILEKLMLASTICDLALSPQDLLDLKAYENGEGPLSERVKNHPLKVIELLKEDQSLVTLETLTIIKQHHERPDGKGFPMAIEHGRINQLSAIFIVAQRFGERICKTNPQEVNYLKIAESIQEEYKGGFFFKTTKALVSEISKVVS